MAIGIIIGIQIIGVIIIGMDLVGVLVGTVGMAQVGILVGIAGMVMVIVVVIMVIIIGTETIGTMAIIITMSTQVAEEGLLLMIMPQMVQEMGIIEIHLLMEEEEIIPITIQQLEITITEGPVPIQTVQLEVILPQEITTTILQVILPHHQVILLPEMLEQNPAQPALLLPVLLRVQIPVMAVAVVAPVEADRQVEAEDKSIKL